MNSNRLIKARWMALGWALAVHADLASAQNTIYSTFVPQVVGYLSGSSPQAAAAAWSQTDMFGDVSVAVRIDGGGATNSGTAYLTTRFGPGTTLADEIAHASYSVSGPQFQPQTVTLFSGLTLGPGTYYLTIVGAGWEYAGSNITPVMAPGVQTVFRERLGTLPFASYPPSGNFQPEFVPPPGFPPPSYWQYSVTSIPEPTPAALLLFGAAVWVAGRYGRRLKCVALTAQWSRRGAPSNQADRLRRNCNYETIKSSTANCFEDSFGASVCRGDGAEHRVGAAHHLLYSGPVAGLCREQRSDRGRVEPERHIFRCQRRRCD